MVSHAHIRLSWVADGADRGVGVGALPDPGGGEGNARIAATRMDFCGCDVSERRGTHAVFDSGTHRVASNISQASARILFFPNLVRGFHLADDKTAAYRAGGFSIANRQLGSPRQPSDAMLCGLLSSFAELFWSSRMEDMEDEEAIPYISGSGEGLMEEGSNLHTSARRDEDIALDLMKFVAMTTGYGRTTSSGVGFQGTGSASKPDEYAAHLLELYGKCRAAVGGKK